MSDQFNPAAGQKAVDGTFPTPAFTQTGYQIPVTLTKSDCEHKLKEAYEEIERLRAEIARLQSEVAFLSNPENHTADCPTRFGLHHPHLHGGS